VSKARRSQYNHANRAYLFRGSKWIWRYLNDKARRSLYYLLRSKLGSITCVETSEPVAALTFDDGPHPRYTPQLLDILDKHNAKATFFLVGEVAGKYPDLVRMIARSGHAIGNHSWDHPVFPGLKTRHRWSQIYRCSRATKPHGQRLFRPPFGAENHEVQLDVFLLGYKVVKWNLSFTDWLSQDSETLSRKVIESVRPGSILLLHDSIYCSKVPDTQWDRGPVLEALDMALTELRDNYRFVTIPALLRSGRAVRSS